MDGDKDGILERSTLGVSLGTPDGLVLGTNEGIIIGSTYGGMLGPSLGTADGIDKTADGNLEGSSVGIPLG